MTDKFPMTKDGLKKLKDELEHLKITERPDVIKAIAEAREHGDLSENAEYHAAREKQSFIEGRISELENKILRANVIDTSNLDSSKVVFGATVEVTDINNEKKFTYRIVGTDEADIEKNLISISAPLCKAMMNKKGPMAKGVMDADTEDMPIVDREKDAMTKGDMGASMYDMNKAPSMRGMKISYGPVSGMNMSNYKKGNGKPAGPAMMGHPSFIKGGKVKK